MSDAVFKEKKNDIEELPIEAKLIELIVTSDITDELLQKFADDNNITSADLQSKIFQIINCFFKGGSYLNNADWDESEMKKCIEEETKEHFQEGNPFAEIMACKIVLDHGQEYYKKEKVL